jgi:hypothetical protein
MNFAINWTLLLGFASLLKVGISGRIIDRFGGKYPIGARCKLLYFDFLNGLEGYTKECLSPVLNTIDHGIRAHNLLNCTSVPYSVLKIAILPNGTYTGAVGFIQRNEADIITLVIRPDNLPYEPGIIGPDFVDAEVAIVSARTQSWGIREKRTLTVFFRDFGDLNYIFSVISIAIFMTTYLVFEHQGESLVQRIGVQRYLKIIEKVFHSLIDQQIMDAQRLKGRIVLGSLNIFIFFLVHGFFMSKIGADMITLKVEPEINRIEELIGPASPRIFTIKQLFFADLLKAELNYRSESINAQIKKKLDSDPAGFLDIEGVMDNPMGALMFNKKILGELLDNKAAMLLEKTLNKYYQKLNCLINTGIASLIRMSSATTAPGTLNFLYSHKIDPRVRRVLDYYLRVQREASLIDTYIGAGREGLIKLLETKPSLRSMQCELGINETLADIRLGYGSFRKLSYSDYEMTFHSMVYAYTFCSAILFYEVGYKKFVGKLSQRQASRQSLEQLVDQQIQLDLNNEKRTDQKDTPKAFIENEARK